MLNYKHHQSEWAHAECILPSVPHDVHPVFLTQLIPISSVLLSFGLMCQLDPLALMRTNGDVYTLLSRVHLPTYATHLPLEKRGLCTSFVEPKCVSSLLACHHIALDKNLGVHLIGIGDNARKIIAKAILFIA